MYIHRCFGAIMRTVDIGARHFVQTLAARICARNDHETLALRTYSYALAYRRATTHKKRISIIIMPHRAIYH